MALPVRAVASPSVLCLGALALALALAWASGCRDPDPVDGGTDDPATDPDPDTDTDTDTAPDTAPTVVWSALVPTIPTLTFAAPPGASARITYALDDGSGPALATPPVTADPDGVVAIALLGLKAGRSYAYTVEIDGQAAFADTLHVLSAPDGLPALVVDLSSPGSQVAGGFVLVSTTTGFGGPNADSWVVIYDGDGDPVWWVREGVGEVTVTTSLGATPGTVWWDRYDMSDPALPATGVQAWLDGSARREFPLVDGHHAVIEPLPGVVTWIARDVRPNPQGDGFVTADRVLEAAIDPVTGALGPARDVVDLYDAVFGGVFASPCSHADAATAVGDADPLYEWTHLNSIAYLAERDAYLVHARWLDAVFLVDRPTGAVLWQLGGPGGQFTLGAGGSPYPSLAGSLLSHAHLSDAWDGGLVAYDNGSHRVPPRTALVELRWDEDARTVDEVWRWEDPTGRFVGILGDVRRLPAGGTVSSWSTLGEIGELDANGVVVWHARTTPLRSVSRLVFFDTLYR